MIKEQKHISQIVPSFPSSEMPLASQRFLSLKQPYPICNTSITSNYIVSLQGSQLLLQFLHIKMEEENKRSSPLEALPSYYPLPSIHHTAITTRTALFSNSAILCTAALSFSSSCCLAVIIAHQHLQYAASWALPLSAAFHSWSSIRYLQSKSSQLIRRSL